jgi:hypothetical protein
MIALGRSLAVARVVSIALSSAAAALPYAALRRVGVPRGRALFAVAFALLSPWGLWLAAATTPESMTASAAAAGAIALATALPARTLAPYAALVAMACLSRYEAWPVAAVLALALAPRALRDKPQGALVALCVAGPLAWMAWNAHAHDGPLHFFRRVSNFKRAIGEGSTDTVAALLLYPRLLFRTRPDAVLGAAAAIAWLRRSDVRRRWGIPLGTALAQLVFLAIGNARDGAPAHHPERAVLGITLVLALFAADVLVEQLARARRREGLAIASVVVAAWLVALRPLAGPPPGSSTADDRRAQLAKGRELAGAASLVVEPCAYEHFALLAAYGAPERATIRPATGGPITAACPRVEAR